MQIAYLKQKIFAKKFSTPISIVTSEGKMRFGQEKGSVSKHSNENS